MIRFKFALPFGCALLALAPVYAAGQPAGESEHYACLSTPSMTDDLRARISQVTKYDFPSYQQFCDTFVRAAILRQRYSGLLNMFGVGDDAVIAAAEVKASSAYMDLERNYIRLALQMLGASTPAPAEQESGSLLPTPPKTEPAPIRESPAPNVIGGAAIPMISPPSQMGQGCPAGTHPWMDGQGNQTCQSFATGQNVTTSANPSTGCPNGAYPWQDNWGNRICRSFNSGPDYYDTSKGCPVGMTPWHDNWGNPICKPN